jgi:hypothetical protein
MEDYSKDYIYLDGGWLKEDQLIQMAFKCGSWKDAEHYLFAYLANALTEGLRKNRKIDWNKKTSARAKMRLMVKKLLKIHKYPPEGQEQALETVMAQCNQWADNEDNLQ